MNKEIKSKLKMGKPEYYDATDGRAVVVQKHSFEQIIRKAKHKGLKVGSWWGSLTLGGQAIFSLETTKEFGSLAGLSGPTWQAIFILIAGASAIVWITLSVSLAFGFFKSFKGIEDEGIDHFFKDENKIK